MTATPTKALLVEDNPGDARLIRELLSESNAGQFELKHERLLSAALQQLSAESFDIVLLDLALPDSQGIDTLKRVRTRAPGAPVVVLTGSDDEQLALNALRKGAQDYLIKGQMDGRLLARAIRYGIERRHAEEMVRRSEERLTRFMESALDCFTLWDSGLRLLECNEAAMKLFPTKSRKDDVLGIEMPTLRPGVRESGRFESYLEVLRTGKPFSAELSLDHPRFGHLDLALKAFRVDNGLGIIATDMTDRIQIHRELQRALDKLQRSNEELEQKASELENANLRLQEADRVKSVFMASMSHELRTPLNSIIGFTGIMLQGLAGPLNEEQSKQLGMVNSSAQHLLSLINDLLDISRIEAGKAELSLEEFSLRDVVTEAMDAISQTATAKGLALETDLPPTTRLVSDRRRLKQVLMNLLSNSVKFTEHGEIRVTARVPDGDTLEIEVADTGIGIPGDQLSRLFEPFQQVETSGGKRAEGTGLGLYLSKKLVTLLGGDMEVDSTHGAGSRFSFTARLRSDGVRDR